MLEALSVVTFSSSSSGESSRSDSIVALLSPVPNMVIFAELQDIAEMLEVEVAHQTEPVETGFRVGTSAGEFLYIL
jgi:hypothetical protein